MSRDEYLTVAEVAEKCGRSKQAIYGRLNKSLQPFVKELNHQKYLHCSVLDFLGPSPDSSTLNKVSIKVEQPLIDLLKDQLDLLTQQLNVKDRQIEELNRLLAQALESNRESHYLIAQARALEAPGKPQEASVTPQKVHWYEKVLRTFKTPQIEE
jgi:small-conductance mechanosensitive channel